MKRNGDGFVSEQEDELIYRKPRRDFKNGIQKTLLVGAFVACFGLILVGDVSAATAQEKFNQTMTNIQVFVAGIGIAFAGIMIVFAGIKWTTTKGRPEEQSRVKAWLLDIGFGVFLISIASLALEIAKGLIVK